MTQIDNKLVLRRSRIIIAVTAHILICSLALYASSFLKSFAMIRYPHEFDAPNPVFPWLKDKWIFWPVVIVEVSLATRLLVGLWRKAFYKCLVNITSFASVLFFYRIFHHLAAPFAACKCLGVSDLFGGHLTVMESNISIGIIIFMLLSSCYIINNSVKNLE